jgi:predicted flap endonuclease-1-like 5' DNA nuclease
VSKSIEAIEGIGPAYGKKLRAVGCTSPARLLKDGGTKKGRDKIAKETGISSSVILRCVNMADLFRIKGVASQYAELLEAAGVDTVKELKNRNAANLAAKMQEVNKAKRLTRTVPSEKMLSDWIKQASKLAPMVSH